MYNRKDRDVHERKEDGQSEFEALNGTNAIMSDNSKAYSIKFLTFNTWGLKYVSKHRKERLRAIADKLAGHSTLTPISDELLPNGGDSNENEDYDVIALQEIWCVEDWKYLASACASKYPYQRLFHSGILTGPGLAILSKVPIESTFLYRFPINGRPSAVFRGDWYVGKSIAITVLNTGTRPIAIMNSHMHAPYAKQGDAAYLCHRSCQAWDFSRLIKLYRQAGYAVIVVGDLNSRPGSLPHKFLTQEAGLVDSWEQLHGKQDLAVIARLSPLQQLLKGCTTCDSLLNTWRTQRQPDEACRLDYALIDPDFLQTVDAGVRFTERIPHLDCSVSDHFAYSCTLNIVPQGTESRPSTSVKRAKTHDRELILQRYSNYETMIECIHTYLKTAQRQKFFRGLHFWASILLLIASLVVTTFTANKAGWSSIFWVLFAIAVSISGTIDGAISFLFGRSEIRALSEVEQEVLDAEHHLQTFLSEK
ncbi:ASB_HP2_G0014980.mRNA.1.CDS.1 [Saccharomyces cerevisiae]|nr:ASB_HP2_G0014980.mRNA.1.CDS.1 [Saccharomyces cerevisiae]CAI6473653.1 ASB_HP1_G0014660.mRNA.1.CDS.1 [Saccharomyces cerevisiae]CAI6474236.1 ASB_HP2_G0014980.mRNA.1.CDS.1 [Saccharomyces cerevisiae]